LLPLFDTVRSSELCLQWECALAADHPFRRAATALGFFTHGAVTLADNTLQRHAVLVGAAVQQHWMYLPPDEVRKLLTERASRDEATGRPIVYVSTDAHALRLYADETWRWNWKMCNGIRVWCIDRHTGRVIHIGGEFTFGDCRTVALRLHQLSELGVLPLDGDYGSGLRATIAVVTDGLDWIADHVVVLYPGAVLVLDVYHALQQVAETAGIVLRGAKGAVAKVMTAARKAVGMRGRRSRTHYRKGPRLRRHRRRRLPQTGCGRRLLVEVQRMRVHATTEAARERLDQLVAYILRNLERMEYAQLRQRGFCIGSGAMESLHRSGSQDRLKRAGARWTASAAQAILNLRMVALSGRWQPFWDQPDLAARVAAAGGAH
jgi:hypothetical protein